MAIMAVNDIEKLCIPINEKLLLELKKIKAAYQMPWNGLLLQLVRINKSPDKLIRRYKRKFEDPKLAKINFEPRCTSTTLIEFLKWCAPFSNQGDALDYLISEENTRGKFHLPNDVPF